MSTPTPHARPNAPAPRRAAGLRAGMEGVVLLMVVLSPWAFGSVHPVSIFALSAGIAALLVLWVGVLFVEKGLPSGPCPVAVCLAGMVILGACQVVPLPRGVLAAVSPGTAAMRDRLLPTSAEQVPGEAPVPEAAHTISFDPDATRADVVNLLAVFALFVAVRYGVASPGSFRRLAVACVVNGVLLSVVALAQRFSSPPDTLYWWFVSQGQVFGPFVCRNHFPFYTNVAFGLGVGLLLASPAFRAGRRRARLGDDPAALWLLAGLGVMLAATAYSMSRGGVVAVVGASAGVGLYAALASRQKSGLAALAVVGGLGLGLVGWFGGDGVGRRMETLGGGAVAEARGPLWERVLPLAAEYPLWGTGYGTFTSVELHRRPPGGPRNISFENAHNEYLNALVEGGACQLALLLVAAALVFRSGAASYRRLRVHRDGAIVLGGLLGLGTAAIHSFGEFGLHVPAIVVLLAVVAAQVAAVGTAGADGRGGLFVAPVVLVALAVAFLLPVEAWRRERADRFRIAAARAELRLPPGDRDDVIRYLDAAIAWAPDDALLRLKRADIRYDEYLARTAHRAGLAELAAAFSPPGWHQVALAPTTDDASRDLEQTYYRPALRDYLAARNLNPLLPRPHVRLAGNMGRLDPADAATRYLDRACLLDPVDAGNWYLAGLAHLSEGGIDRGCECWRKSLECGPVHLALIAPEAHRRLGVAALLDRVLPADPDVLVAAANLPHFARHPTDRRAVLSRAADLLDEAASPPERLHLRGSLLREAGRPADAITAFQKALDIAPEKFPWRLELAELLLAGGNLAGAEKEVRRVLRERPGHQGATDLADAIKEVRRNNK